MRFCLSSMMALTGAAAIASCASAPQQQPVQQMQAAPTRTASAPTQSAPKAPAPSVVQPASSGVMLCPKMTVSNAPAADKDGNVIGGPNVNLDGVFLMIAPATNVCLSSGYGPRNGKTHRGVDYHTRTSGNVLAAGDGVVVEAVSRADFGNMVVIDHGGGVFTRYAHLASFSAASKAGAKVRRGDKLGPIGATGATSVLHLHYEIMSGKYVSGVGSFGLKTHDPYSLPSVRLSQTGEAANAS